MSMEMSMEINLMEMKSSLTKSPLLSSSSTLYNDDMVFLKVYKKSKEAQRLFNSELNTYKKLSKVDGLAPYVPKLLESSSSHEKYLLVENRGLDCIQIINSTEHSFDYPMWKQYLLDVSNAMTIMHDHDIIHGDIKPENTTYDFKKATWSLIDFGFSLQESVRFHGTLPYCAPHNTMDTIRSRTIRNGPPGLNLHVVNDIYSFAMSALSLYGLYFNVESIPSIYIDIGILSRIYKKDLMTLNKIVFPKNTVNDDWTKEVLRLLAGMVLTQTDTRSRYLVWVRAGCYCYFTGSNPVFCNLEFDDIMEYWKRFTTIIKNH